MPYDGAQCYQLNSTGSKNDLISSPQLMNHVKKKYEKTEIFQNRIEKIPEKLQSYTVKKKRRNIHT